MTIRDRIFYLALALNECLVLLRRSKREIVKAHF